MTYTYVTLTLSQSAYEEIKSKLLAADYGHCIDRDGTIDMHGLAVIRAKDEIVTE